jgi:hypothetical protein
MRKIIWIIMLSRGRRKIDAGCLNRKNYEEKEILTQHNFKLSIIRPLRQCSSGEGAQGGESLS